MCVCYAVLQHINYALLYTTRVGYIFKNWLFNANSAENIKAKSQIVSTYRGVRNESRFAASLIWWIFLAKQWAFNWVPYSKNLSNSLGVVGLRGYKYFVFIWNTSAIYVKFLTPLNCIFCFLGSNYLVSRKLLENWTTLPIFIHFFREYCF